MAVTGVGLQTSLYITLLLIFPPSYLSLSICRSVSISFPLPLPLGLVCLSFREVFFFIPFSDCCGPRRCCCSGGCHHSAEKNIYSQLFYFFSSSCHSIPRTLKGLDYFGVTSTALSSFLFTKRSLEEEP